MLLCSFFVVAGWSRDTVGVAGTTCEEISWPLTFRLPVLLPLDVAAFPVEALEPILVQNPFLKWILPRVGLLDLRPCSKTYCSNISRTISLRSSAGRERLSWSAPAVTRRRPARST